MKDRLSLAKDSLLAGVIPVFSIPPMTHLFSLCFADDTNVCFDTAMSLKGWVWRLSILFWIIIGVSCSAFLFLDSSASIPVRASLVRLLSSPSQTLRETASIEHNNETVSTPDDLSYFQVLAGNIVNCLVKSDLKRDSGWDGSSTGWTSWVEDSSALRLQSCMDKLCLVTPVSIWCSG